MLHRRMRGAGGIGPMQPGMYGAGTKPRSSAHHHNMHDSSTESIKYFTFFMWEINLLQQNAFYIICFMEMSDHSGL